MKKFLAMLFSLALLVSLSAPAFSQADTKSDDKKAASDTDKKPKKAKATKAKKEKAAKKDAMKDDKAADKK